MGPCCAGAAGGLPWDPGGDGASSRVGGLGLGLFSSIPGSREPAFLASLPGASLWLPGTGGRAARCPSRLKGEEKIKEMMERIALI